ncbi:cdp-4-keto-6-deoxy-d-glucose-3-dehydrase : DegT/DnrJ/EryC1/StrS aminotransferase family protein OS=Nitrospina gracilis (strain 3/211) GN=NITGR_170046 PE=3 SV=1: DegT_DnrJ_EryC1 [Gemmata massiliana]|uniref:CDP-4-keto-6-deoxy-D-glucose-3-dehydrase n=1 Tax=Gemmata massiliana TaxID=1210884 RepID=A0A6P2CZT1_9BACT|nr:DegT/DnrJ/EryC1/StrS aminotransferase family protein [Gemmata massiliana]VTR94389.1 cdp-4-keto-6-deoxy-d-glucose-3-dehydrase : DegT/DnrJ/EryC1/StrS aminotransferase family protein OS=Nitrospina gracilis (strain 3/211) GN=NITGR_170046 PE=3 SV=1: DegT_DnrJ_EryC1 [Gemmata massiliana]
MPTTKSATAPAKLNWPLMKNNIAREDLNAVIDLLQQDDPILTQSKNVRAFEEEWSQWLGVKHSVFVNSGSSANLVTIAALKELHPEGGEVIVPAITWVSDIAAVLHCGFTPVFADIDPRTLSMDPDQILAKLTSRTRAVFLTHVLGYNALTRPLLNELEARGVPLIEDVCESHGATFEDQKLGSFGWASNFSFYYAHHLSTIEGGMVCTNDENLYEAIRMFRAHGMVREMSSDSRKRDFAEKFPDLNPDFIFAFPAYNVRSTEINAVIGRSQLRRLDDNNQRRTANFMLFLRNLDPTLYRTDFRTEGSSNYAFTLVLKEPDPALSDRVTTALRAAGVEFRRGTAGGGNQLRQPYLRRLLGDDAWKQCPKADHVHFYGFYIGNYPTLEADRILQLCDLLNGLGR